MSTWPDHLRGRTFHGRSGNVANRFSYGVDFLLIDPESRQGPAVFSRNRRNLFAIHDRDHGGPRDQGRGLAWAREVFAARGFADADAYQIRLLTQPRLLDMVFNPVSFWLLLTDGRLHAVIAEVNNTYGDRHSYFCAREDLQAIGPKDEITAEKVFHVSPFQALAGQYSFRFNVTEQAIDIVIGLSGDAGRLVATLQGRLRPASSAGLMAAALRRPFGALRVLGLIHWQALKLWWKGARFLTRPQPPKNEVS